MGTGACPAASSGGILTRLHRAGFVFYLASVALLPWAWWPPFPWLHHHAQWSDALFAVAIVLIGLSCFERQRGADAAPDSAPWCRAQVEPWELAALAYASWAVVSLVFASLRTTTAPAKTLGIGMLALLALATRRIAARPEATRAIATAIGWSSLAAAAAALVAVSLAALGIWTPLLGHYGDLVAGPYVRVRAGTLHANQLASFTIFAIGVVHSRQAGLSRRLRTAATVALAVTAVLTVSRGLLGFLLALGLARARSAGAKRLVAAFGGLAAALIVGLTAVDLKLDPARPWSAEIGPDRSPRLEALVTSLGTLARHPLVGIGPGNSPGRRYGLPFDAHCTPVSVAATLGLPALVAFGAIPVLLWRGGRGRDLALWGALAGLGLDALANDLEDFRPLWMLFGLIGASRLRLGEKSQDELTLGRERNGT
jgi:hypothetical protein